MVCAVVDQRVRVIPPEPGDSVPVPRQQLNSYPSLVSSRPSSALIRSNSLLTLPCQTNHLARLISVLTDSRSGAEIILLLNTARCAA